MGRLYLLCCDLQTPDSFSLGMQRCLCHSLLASCNDTSPLSMTPVLSEHHPVLLLNRDWSKVQARDGIGNSVMGVFNVKNFGTNFLDEQFPLVDMVRR